MEEKRKVDENCSEYVPVSERNGEKSVVYFTRDLSEQGLVKIFERIKAPLKGNIAVKVHTGEPHGPNIIPVSWVKNLLNTKLEGAKIVETNTYYEMDRYTSEQHKNTLKINGWDLSDVDIMDEDGVVELAVKNGKWFKAMSLGKNILNYDSMLVLTHFKGHTQGGFGGSNKNIGIGCADGRIGKAMIHTTPNQPDQWDIAKEEFMERMTESTKSVADHFGENITYINVMRNMSVSCDCEGIHAQPVVTPNVGICASLDILSVDQACVDIVYAMKEDEKHALVERIESRHGLRQLSYMKELGMGNDRYSLIDIDNNDAQITPADAAKDLVPFVNEK